MTAPSAAPAAVPHRPAFDLGTVRAEILESCERLRDRDGPTGCYRSGPRLRSDLYSSLDVALMRVIMGEDFARTLSTAERGEWVDHINSFAQRRYDLGGDGSYEDTFGHDPLHANGMVIGALGPLGGRQPYPVRLYDGFDTPEKVQAWLDGLNWANQWRGSHLFWGGMHCFSFSRACTPAWREAVFDWLDRELDPATGWWRRGVPHADRHQALGGSVHIVPIYAHHGRPFPYPERVIDSVLDLQLPDGRWLNRPGADPMHYLELDALYALRVMRDLAPEGYRADDIEGALDRFIALVGDHWQCRRTDLLARHPHWVLAAVGTFGLLQQHRPDQFRDVSPNAAPWTDIFSDRRFYLTEEVEVLA